MLPPPPRSTLFPYTTLFRSNLNSIRDVPVRHAERAWRETRPHPIHVTDDDVEEDRKSTRLNSSHGSISYAVFCLKKKKEWTPRLRHVQADDSAEQPAQRHTR